MLFNSLEYVTFLLTIFALYWALVRHARLALALLLGASLLFYACWNPHYLILIVASSLIDFIVGGRIARTEDAKRRKRLLWTSVAYNLGVLALFKYFNFFMGNVEGLIQVVDDGFPLIQIKDKLTILGFYLGDLRLNVLLPVGISFFTFQSMSYTIDIYRKQLEPVNSYPRYLLYVSFFPQLVAGPIVRARDLLPQLLNRPPLTDEMGGRGLYLIALGLFKKIVIADFLALNIVDRVFAMPSGFSAFEVLFGIYGYAFQIYCDFSGYSDIAIGSALLLGFTFPDNFNAPYKAGNLQEFWRRWHISLSSWLRDYLYIPLGGSKDGPVMTYRNLLLTMLLGGLWHGAGWNFIIWGALHGGAQAVLRFWQRRRARRGGMVLLGGWRKPIAVFITFHYVCFAWIFFRAPTFDNAMDVLRTLGTLSFSAANLTPSILLTLGVATLTHFWPRASFDALVRGFTRLPAPLQALAVIAVGFGLKAAASTDVVPFIYFQF
ncbi:MBOAT family protein [Myxococcota bacterium]|nr:MBOAT family protein [Myxococcota bacterium]MBU1431560.1 MBOAT family protein [Myxococcota bacterium]MBU1898754.1 MBOAT family protein [Myxococcota bacterium]